MVASATFGEDGNVDEGDQKCRPMENKVAKKLKEKKANEEVNDLETSAAQMAGSVVRMEKAILAAQEAKANIAERRMALKRRKLDWEMVKELVGPASDANEFERIYILQTLRKRLLSTFMGGEELATETKKPEQTDSRTAFGAASTLGETVTASGYKTTVAISTNYALAENRNGHSLGDMLTQPQTPRTLVMKRILLMETERNLQKLRSIDSLRSIERRAVSSLRSSQGASFIDFALALYAIYTSFNLLYHHFCFNGNSLVRCSTARALPCSP